MLRFILFIFIISAQVFSDTFPTALGDCTLEIYGGRVEDIPEIVQQILDETENLVNEFGTVDSRPFSVYITSNMDDFREKSKGPIPEWGIAVAKLNPDRAILKSPGIANISFTRMKEVIIHELNHIYMFRIPNYYTIPSWFKEGMAMRSSNEFSLLHKIEISNSYWKKQTLPLQRLRNFNTYSKGRVKLVYGESAAAVEALEYYYGEDILISILNKMRLGSDFQQALESASGEELLDFQIKFELYLENNFNWVFLLRASKYIFVILPIILILGFIYHRRRGKKIVKQWEIEEQLEDLERNKELPN
tara:strand:+ start:442 stop:1356 length:915 start_codon:yes stop_codon:yes gene_type:complete